MLRISILDHLEASIVILAASASRGSTTTVPGLTEVQLDGSLVYSSHHFLTHYRSFLLFVPLPAHNDSRLIHHIHSKFYISCLRGWVPSLFLLDLSLYSFPNKYNVDVGAKNLWKFLAYLLLTALLCSYASILTFATVKSIIDDAGYLTRQFPDKHGNMRWVPYRFFVLVPFSTYHFFLPLILMLFWICF